MKMRHLGALMAAIAQLLAPAVVHAREVVLHVSTSAQYRTVQSAIDALPDGAMLCRGDRTFAKHGRNLRAWTFRGWADEWDYHDPALYGVRLLTPPTTVEILRRGYKPVWHPTIGTLPRERGLPAG